MSESAMRQGRSSWTSATAVLAVFAMAQTTPRLYPGDSALTGQGRMFAIHMFDALVTCESTLTFRSSTAETTVRMRPQFTYPRIACDPLVYFQLARAECRARRIESPGEDFDLLLRSRAGGVPAHQTVVDIPRFCASGTSYSVFGNEWIKPVRRGQSAAPAGAQQTASAVDAR